MQVSTRFVDSHRAQFDGNLSAKEIELLAENEQLRVLQCCSPVPDQTWARLDELLARRPDIEIRVYGFLGSVCDLSFVRLIPNARQFRADYLMKAVGVEHLACLQKLESLGIGIYDLENFSFLHSVTPGIKHLSLFATKSKKPSLSELSRFCSLTTLYLESQVKDIEVIGELGNLEDLTLRSITLNDLNFLSELPRLWSLDMKLGGTTNLSGIAGKESIKYLELWQIKGLSHIDVVSSLRGLQYLFLQSLRRVESIPELSQLGELRRIYLENMKGLRDLKGVASAPNLQEFSFVSALNMKPFDFAELLKMPTLQRLWVGLGSEAKNRAIREMIVKSGKTYDAPPPKFQFQHVN